MKNINCFHVVGVLCLIFLCFQFGLQLNQPYTQLGMQLQTTNAGYKVASTAPNGPGSKAGILPGFIFTRINNLQMLDFFKQWADTSNYETFKHYSQLFENGTIYEFETVTGSVYKIEIPKKQSISNKLKCLQFENWIIFLTSLLFILFALLSSCFIDKSDETKSFIYFMYAAGICIFNSYSYAANTFFYTSMNMLVFDLAGTSLCAFFLQCTIYFYRLSNSKENVLNILNKIKFLPPLLTTIKYILIHGHTKIFFDSSMFFLVHFLLAITLLFAVFTVCFLLRKIPRQSSTFLRFFLVGLCFGALPAAITLVSRVFMGSYWTINATETFYTIAPLLLIPLSVASALFKTIAINFDIISSKTMTVGCTLIITTIILMIARNITPNILYISLTLSSLTPILYILLEKPITLFLCPKIEYMQKNLDILESDIFLCDNINTIYSRTADWIFTTINASFVSIYSLNNIGSNTEGTYKELFREIRENTINCAILSQMLDDRTSKCSLANNVLFHGKNGFSVPLYRSHELYGYMLIGNRISINFFSNEEVRLLIPVARILMESIMMYEILQFKKRSNQIHDAFSKYLSSSVVENLMEHPDFITMNGIKKKLTIMFTDLQGFTTLSEQTDATILVSILNHYLNEMSKVILDEGGTIDKFEGDAIMCFFSDTPSHEDSAIKCCRAALKMLKVEQKVNSELIEEGLLTKPLHTRIGMNTGEVIVGNIGSADRLEYTIIGKQVNIASRIESINKEYSTSILISANTYNIVKDNFICHRITDTVLRGLSEPITLYELLEEK